MIRTHRVAVAALAVLSGVAQAAAADEADGRLEEIVVTAQKRSENLQKVPISITAITGDLLESQGASSVRSLADLTAGVKVQGTNAPAVFVRGIGTSNSSSTGDQGVALHLDGVYQARPTAFAAGFIDIERVEILKGPQGTLYGRGALGGNINVISKTPEDRFGGTGTLELGNYSLWRIGGVLNVPLADRLAARLAVQTQRHEGYSANGADDADLSAARLRVQYDPTDTVSLGVTAFWSRAEGQGAGYHRFRAYPGLPLDRNEWANSISNGQYLDAETLTLSGKMDWDLGFATLTYIPAYTDDEYSARFPALIFQPAPFNVDGITHSDLVTHELRLASPSDRRLEWTAGLFAMDEKLNYDLKFLPFVATFGNFRTRSEAAFGQLRVAVHPRVRLIGGLRVNRDTKTQNTNFGNHFENSWTSTTGRVGAEWEFRDASLLYLTASEGFKAGGFFTAPPPNYFDPETVRSYELGSKNRWFDDRLQINGSIFFNDYENYQANAFVPGFNGSITQGVLNAGAAQLYGLEIEGIFQPTPQDRIEASLTSLRSEFTSFKANAISGRVGDALPFSPEWSANLAYEHGFGLRGAGTLSLRGDIHFESKSWLSLNHRQFTSQGEYTRSSVTATYQTVGGRLKLAAWVRNIEDEAVVTTVSDSLNFENYILAPPRTYGLTLSTEF
ncbi:MAG: TonB-dependent receptor [Gammaproteobacteria bacterium]|nr:TonB-dependent receptor [Gammaproteobacteria bacterium]